MPLQATVETTEIRHRLSPQEEKLVTELAQQLEIDKNTIIASVHNGINLVLNIPNNTVYSYDQVQKALKFLQIPSIGGNGLQGEINIEVKPIDKNNNILSHWKYDGAKISHTYV